MEEVWKDVVGYERTYEVSDQGRVRSKPRPRSHGSFKAQNLNERGYYVVWLCQDGKRRAFKVHRLVLIAFAGSPPAGMEARHLNGDSQDNRLSNLAWGTRSRNNVDKRDHGTSQQEWTHCSQGHELAGRNRTIGSRGDVRCRQCANRRTREWRARRKAGLS